MWRSLVGWTLVGLSSCSVAESVSGADATTEDSALDAGDALVQADAGDSAMDGPSEAEDGPPEAAEDGPSEAAQDGPTEDTSSDAPDGHTGTLLFADDFEDATLEGWRITSPLGVSDAFSQVGGVLVSGPGQSSSYWNSPVCDPIGPAVVQSPAFAVGNGRFTIETDIFHTGLDDCNVVLWVALVDAGVETHWNPSTLSLVFDAIAQFLFVPKGGAHTGEVVSRIHAASGSQGTAESFGASQTSIGEWYRLHVELCGSDGFFVRLTDDTGSFVYTQGYSATPVVVSPGTTEVRFEVMTEGKDKAIDNVRVTSGCEVMGDAGL